MTTAHSEAPWPIPLIVLCEDMKPKMPALQDFTAWPSVASSLHTPSLSLELECCSRWQGTMGISSTSKVPPLSPSWHVCHLESTHLPCGGDMNPTQQKSQHFLRLGLLTLGLGLWSKEMEILPVVMSQTCEVIFISLKQVLRQLLITNGISLYFLLSCW